MRVVAGVLCVCACNQAFDLKGTQLAGVDALTTCCTPDGYSKRLVQDISQNCYGTSYTFSEATGRAMGVCQTTDRTFLGVVEGPLDLEMSPAGIVPEAGLSIIEARLTSDGTEAWVELRTLAGPTKLGIWNRVADQQWTFSRYLDLNAGQEQLLVGIYETTAGRRLMIQVSPGRSSSTLVERSDDGSGTWSAVERTIAMADIGVDYFDKVGISADGRRIIFSGETGSLTSVFEADRTDALAPFAAAAPLPNVPFTYDVTFYPSNDCTRLYFPALESIFYTQASCTCR